MARHRQEALTAVASVAALATAVACGGPPTDEMSATNDGADDEWSVVYGDAELGDSFSALAAVDSGDVWAFGGTDADNPAAWAHHWDGSEWSQQETPDDWALDPTAADASGGDDVWATGAYPEGGGGVLHYDGSTWSVSEVAAVSSPHDIEVPTADDIWLLGEEEGAWLLGEEGSEVARFDGESWSEIATPRVGNALSVTDDEAAFTVGSVGRQPAVDMWNGQEWESMEVPEVDLSVGGESSAAFDDVYARSADDVWAVGHLYHKDSEEKNHYRPLVGQWDGTEWRVTVEDDDYDGGYERVTGDGDGGLWMARSAWEPVMVHQDAEGTTTEHPITDDTYDLSLDALERVPGTTAALASGTMFEDGDPEVSTNHGRIYAYGM